MERYRLAEKPREEPPRAVLPAAKAVLPAAKAVLEVRKVVLALAKEALELEKVVRELEREELELEREQQAEQRQAAFRLLKTFRLCKEWASSDSPKLDHKHVQDQL
ncbi:hypothetical protein INS49_011498 [Diaporthe citri]|uniref:uncharacterized protein n=1 Tax=Diaporthe citri TaxID=83186 RepID=UPI001C8201D6|nr:uncharacterized protein INS49_011498 [Diaporthe citri]KAG6360438.1 hypothetical protein INS49_011498 [Diaporthe citri]